MAIEKQKNCEIPIEKLILWTENPRDDINPNASNIDIIKNALKDEKEKWNLKALSNSMGSHFDYSEIPTVVYHNGFPIVYDGNRRVILAMLKLKIYKDLEVDFKLPEVGEKIPCNVCEKNIALENVYRKHADNGSWSPLERDKFCAKFMKDSKSDFLIIDEATSIISENKELNQVFVKNEIFNRSNIEKLGFSISKGDFKTQHSESNTQIILNDILDAVKTKKITTRKNRGRLLEVLSESTKKIIFDDKSKGFEKYSHITHEIKTTPSKGQGQKTTPRTQSTTICFFGKKLYLKSGPVNNLYRDIMDLYNYYEKKSKEKTISSSFIGLIRMSLRLIAELAANEKEKTFDKFLKDNFAAAKKNLSQDMKTFLANNNVTETSIIQLLHTGAHNYTASLNTDTTIAMSVILGEIFSINFGVDKK